MNTVLQMIHQQDIKIALDRQKEILLEVAQVFDDEIIDVRIFDTKSSVHIGSQVGHRLRFAGQPIAWVPSSFSALSFVMYPFLQTQDEWKSDFFSMQQGELISWNNGKASVHVPDGWKCWYQTQEGQESIVSSNHTLELDLGQHLIIEGEKEWFSLRYVHPSESTPRPWVSYIDGGSLGIVAAVLLSFLTFFYGMQNHEPTSSNEDIETVLQMYEATARIQKAPMPEEVITVSPQKTSVNGTSSKNKIKVGNSKTTGTKNTPSGPVSKSKVVSDFLSGLDFGGPSDVSSDIIASKHTLGNIEKGGIGSGGNDLGSMEGWSTSGGGDGSAIDELGSVGQIEERRSGTSSAKPTRVRNKIMKTSSSYAVLGGLSRSLVDRVIKRNLAQIRYCYQRQLAKSPDLRGKITVKFVISKDGSVARTSIDKTTMNSPKVEDCISNRFMKFNFPKPDGGIVIVKYPFVFQSTQ